MNRSMYMIVYYDFDMMQDLITLLDNRNKLKEYANYQWAFVKHDKDTTIGGKQKKEHYHLVLKFQQAIESIELFNVIKNYLPNHTHEDINKCDVKGWSYLAHWNTPKKVQYDFDDVITNRDRESLYEDMIKYKKSDNYQLQANYLKWILTFNKENDISDFRSLIVKLVENEEDDILGFVTKNVYLIKSLYDYR